MASAHNCGRCPSRESCSRWWREWRCPADACLDDGLPPWLTTLLFGGDAGAARTLLDAIASSLITVTSLTFSLTVVTLQLASSQFSPRLLRTFTSDIFVQATLAIFLSTFTYCADRPACRAQR